MSHNRRRSAITLLSVGVIAAGLLLGLGPASAQQLPQPVVGTPGGLLANGGFDAADRLGHPTGWSVLGAANDVSLTNAKDTFSAGPDALKIADTGESVSVLSDWIVATPGKKYTVTAKVKGASGTLPHLTLRFYDFNRTVLASQEASPSFSTSFQPVTISGTAPANTALVSVIISTAAAGTSYWDELGLTGDPQAYDPALGSTRELFLDDYRIDSTSNVGRVVHPADKRPTPVLRPDKPWEQSAYIYGSVYKVGDVYRMWYTCTNDVEPKYFLCYAESTDGVTWTKPNVGTIGYKDIPAAQTNIVHAAGGTVAYNPDAPADHRYALLFFQSGTANDTLGYYASFSADGYHWTAPAAKPVLLDGDVSNVTYDTATHQYIASIKKRMFTSRTPSTYDRSAFIATSKDFLTWSTPVLGVSGDYADDGAAEAVNGLEGQIYGMPVLPYESTYVGLPWRFLIKDFTTGMASGAGDGPIAPQLASSRDLTDWSRPVRDSVLTPGGPGAWDDGTIYTASDILVDSSKITLYYGGFNVDHGGVVTGDPSRATQVGQVGMATWRRDGFESLSNTALPGTGDPGQVTTKDVTFTGSTLHVNAVVHPQGSLKVEVLDATSGAVIDGYTGTVSGDQLDAPISWQGGKSLSDLDGKSVKFRFSLTNADLYSYWVS